MSFGGIKKLQLKLIYHSALYSPLVLMVFITLLWILNKFWWSTFFYCIVLYENFNHFVTIFQSGFFKPYCPIGWVSVNQNMQFVSCQCFIYIFGQLITTFIHNLFWMVIRCQHSCRLFIISLKKKIRTSLNKSHVKNIKD